MLEEQSLTREAWLFNTPQYLCHNLIYCNFQCQRFVTSITQNALILCSNLETNLYHPCCERLAINAALRQSLTLKKSLFYVPGARNRQRKENILPARKEDGRL